MKLKIIQYNILNGLCCEQRPYSLDDGRKRNFLRILEREKPDILVLCEASCWPTARQESSGDYEKIIREMCEKDLGNDGSFRWAPAIITRFPMESKNMSEYFRSFLRTRIKVGGKTINLDAVHPHPELSEKERAEFFSRIIKTGKNPYIIAGDFNSLSPEDNYDLQRLIKGYESFMGGDGKAKAEDIITAHALMPLMKKGLIDTHLSIKRNGGFTVPTDWRNKGKDSAVRLDYIFCSEEFRIIDSGIINDDLTNSASDHHPIFAVLEI